MKLQPYINAMLGWDEVEKRKKRAVREFEKIDMRKIEKVLEDMGMDPHEELVKVYNAGMLPDQIATAVLKHLSTELQRERHVERKEVKHEGLTFADAIRAASQEEETPSDARSGSESDADDE